MAGGDGAAEDNGPQLIAPAPAEMAGTVFPLTGPEMIIGHSEMADLVPDDVYVSRRHALITIDATGAVTIHGLNSTAGTRVNGELMEGPRVLQAGDIVSFADLDARFEPAARLSVPGASDQPTRRAEPATLVLPRRELEVTPVAPDAPAGTGPAGVPGVGEVQRPPATVTMRLPPGPGRTGPGPDVAGLAKFLGAGGGQLTI